MHPGLITGKNKGKLSQSLFELLFCLLSLLHICSLRLILSAKKFSACLSEYKVLKCTAPTKMPALGPNFTGLHRHRSSAQGPYLHLIPTSWAGNLIGQSMIRECFLVLPVRNGPAVEANPPPQPGAWSGQDGETTLALTLSWHCVKLVAAFPHQSMSSSSFFASPMPNRRLKCSQNLWNLNKTTHNKNNI